MNDWIGVNTALPHPMTGSVKSKTVCIMFDSGLVSFAVYDYELLRWIQTRGGAYLKGVAYWRYE